MPMPRDLTAYLDSLPPARRALFDRLSQAVREVAVPGSIESFVFRAGDAQHPVFDDAPDVFWRAVKQLQLREAASDGELPLVYWGFHSIDLLARRHANGILVTDRTTYLDDVGRESARFATVSIDPSTIGVVGERLEVQGAGVGLAQMSRMLEPTSAADSASYLVAVLRAVTDVIAGAGSTPGGSGARSDDGGGAASPTNLGTGGYDDDQATVESLVLASRLGPDFLLPSRPKNAKGLAKLAAKWNLPADERLLASFSSATIAGIYGIAITDRAVYSRDLMEPVNRTPFAEVTGFEWDAEAKGFRIAPGHTAPTLPLIDDDNRAYVSNLFLSLFQAASA